MEKGRGEVKARLAVITLMLLALAVDSVRGEAPGVPVGPCGSAPPAEPQRRKGGEAFPPLPLPATPLRRTEKKRPPAPPPLVAKIKYGDVLEVMHEGKPVRYHDWNKDPGDIGMLLNTANRALDIRYTSRQVGLAVLSADPAEFPIYYYTGSSAFTLGELEREHLRAFLLSGGTIWGDTCFGDPEFFKAFVSEMGKVLPDRQFRRLPPSHPLFHSYYQIEGVRYTRDVPDASNGELVFYGMDIGCRTAIILSRYDLSCGWDGHIRKGAMSVHPDDARQLGVNMIAYSLAMHGIGRYQGSRMVYYEKDERARGDFVFAQAKLTENWDSQHNAIANLLKAVATTTSAEVKFERRAVDLARDDLQQYPFLYFTGHYDFELTEEEGAALRRYLSSGGFLLGSPCCGSPEFDVAFRREMARVLPGLTLEALAEEHPVYSILYDIKGVRYNEYVEGLGLAPPSFPLEGISIGGTVPVIYCRYGIGGGWRGFDHPFARSIYHEDATKLGVNIIMYAMTH